MDPMPLADNDFRVKRDVLRTLVKHGAPDRILIDNKPHLGTDRLVRILKDMRQWLIEHGAEFRFSTKVENICIGSQEDGGKRFVSGVQLSTGEKVNADFVVLAVGHSARQLYRRLQESEVALVAKPIAVGFRIEHPQELINQIQYGDVFSQQCLRGKGPVPVADYRLATQVEDSLAMSKELQPSTRGVSDSEYDEGYAKREGERSCYSFCMCPGGQIGECLPCSQLLPTHF